jgi:hypothetical protein
MSRKLFVPMSVFLALAVVGLAVSGTHAQSTNKD